MNIVERAKNIILKPKDEWQIIDNEDASIVTLIATYLIPLSLIPAISAFVGYGIIGVNIFGPSLSWGIKQAFVVFISNIFGICISAFIINNLAPNFGSTKAIGKAMQLAIYSYTPVMLAGAFQAIPSLGLLGIIGLYGLYLLYVGIKPMMKTPDDKAGSYFLVSMLTIIAVYFILVTVLTLIFIGRHQGVVPVMR